ncbi:uncharacterized protein N7446_005623 [Penicillium canescens]|uniref:COMM domain-containing protein n=1 Tax=Penicillium canescens TaxID=5083 RepID=A0AAD6II51_PENCN|nr:uncharacterized protein N7446_005623 [Penicillium canescens]KAJ6050132.1 hypothetical protein N7444_006848 [Penicillium canescens]KAJ6050995.1 hypothetical protein N7460_001529 [Penicillium canescens]KAJ6061503.1 hypothetical protein N7446_005623 [Penicillium canescens]
MVNRFGKRLEQIGQLITLQKVLLLQWAKSDGFTRWHILSATDRSVISSTHRSNCQISFSVVVRFELTDKEYEPAINPLALDMNQLRKLVRDFGRYLDDLRKLTKP